MTEPERHVLEIVELLMLAAHKRDIADSDPGLHDLLLSLETACAQWQLEAHNPEITQHNAACRARYGKGGSIMAIQETGKKEW